MAAAIPFIGLTGAMAAGKSEALAALERLGAATLSADAVVHELLDSERIRDPLIQRWGERVAPGGRIDRRRVGEIVFERPDELAWLEGILHPAVGEEIAAWRGRLPRDLPLAVAEVPLLFETGMEGDFDATICVVAADEVRAARASDRKTQALQGRSERQLSQEEKAARATYVVRNDGTLAELEATLAELVGRIVAESEREP